MGTGLDSHMVEHHLAEEMGSISVARQVARDALMTWGYRGRFEDVLLVVSEMVTNALVHGAGAPVLRIAGGLGHIRVEVGDSSDALPRPRSPGPSDGWGLHVVEELSIAWGTSLQEGGKVVWCDLAAPLTAVTTAD
ncbi:ATP-binding protein [Nonomuraea sp. C10]|uniref:ATP-binding protein n=1 Tax=Nonomuraea sp. C10 TaxID=2600577 RepID=UPI0011CE7BFF|nr:ATP-binding protein [Nonomuraea sp. C10]TXK41295.1 ATP-binding protein [Nonomuraea sp. C10]